MVTMRGVLGRAFADVDEILRELGVSTDAARETKHFSDCTYCNVKAAGVALACDGRDAPPTRSLGCIHTFAANKEGYAPCALQLPHGRLLGLTGMQLVVALVEPERKGGGASFGGIFVAYERLGFQANFERAEWAADNTVKGYDIFKAKS